MPSYPADLRMLGQTGVGAASMSSRTYGQSFPGVSTSTVLRE